MNKLTMKKLKYHVAFIKIPDGHLNINLYINKNTIKKVSCSTEKEHLSIKIDKFRYNALCKILEIPFINTDYCSKQIIQKIEETQKLLDDKEYNDILDDIKQHFIYQVYSMKQIMIGI